MYGLRPSAPLPRDMHRSTPIALLFIAGLLPSCALTRATDNDDPLEQPRIKVEAFHQSTEYDELEFDPDDGPAFDAEDVERSRTGARATYGTRLASSYAQLFTEEFDDSAFPTGTIDGYGFGFGALGAIDVHRFENGATLLVPYRGATSLVLGSEAEGTLDSDLTYFDFEGEVGIGVATGGFQSSLGFFGTSVYGEIDTDDATTSTSTTIDLTGSAFGAYVQLEYDDSNRPFTGRIRAALGTVTVVEVSIGFVL